MISQASYDEVSRCLCVKGRYGTFSLERDTAPIIVPKCRHFVAVLRIRRNRCLISDRFSDSAIKIRKQSFGSPSFRVKVGETRLSHGFVEGKNNRTPALMP